jgi:hypothetical protein
MLPKIPAPKSKTLSPIAKNQTSSPQFISNQSPAIIATRYTLGGGSRLYRLRRP